MPLDEEISDTHWHFFNLGVVEAFEFSNLKNKIKFLIW